jgi:hypothetical protein
VAPWYLPTAPSVSGPFLGLFPRGLYVKFLRKRTKKQKFYGRSRCSPTSGSSAPRWPPLPAAPSLTTWHDAGAPTWASSRAGDHAARARSPTTKLHRMRHTRWGGKPTPRSARRCTVANMTSYATLQKNLRSMTIDFRHRSSKFRHKTTSMTKFQIVMYWASEIKRRDEFNIFVID